MASQEEAFLGGPLLDDEYDWGDGSSDAAVLGDIDAKTEDGDKYALTHFGDGTDKQLATAAGGSSGSPRRIRDRCASALIMTDNRKEAEAQLLAFYRERVKAFESEREDVNKRLAEMEISTKEMHRVEWDLRIRREEVGELQRALSDSHLYLHEERQLVLKMQAETDRLKVHQLEDRQRIQQLLAMTGSSSARGRRGGGGGSVSQSTFFHFFSFLYCCTFICT